jgi:integrase
VRDGKTGFRAANTMPGAGAVYERILKRYPDKQRDDYLFLPQYKNRTTASKIFQRQFKELMARAGIEVDPVTGKKHTIYSLRHTATCMRLILSEGKVNIFNLAKNAGTSVDQIERFYARNLPLSKEIAINLQSFGGDEAQ